MPISVLNSWSRVGLVSPNFSTPISVSPANGHGLWLGMWNSDVNPVLSVQDNHGNSFIRDSRVDYSGSGLFFYMFHLNNTSGVTSVNITFTNPSDSGGCGVIILELSTNIYGDVFSSTFSIDNTDPATFATINTTVTNDFVIGIGKVGDNTPLGNSGIWTVITSIDPILAHSQQAVASYATAGLPGGATPLASNSVTPYLVGITGSYYAATGFDFGFDFRLALGYATDPAYAAFVVAGESFPHTFTNANGLSVVAGFTDANATSANRISTGQDPRLAGIVYTSLANSGGNTNFRITLPHAGQWNVQLAIGDGGDNQVQYLSIFDNTTLLSQTGGAATPFNSFIDATGTLYSAAAWPSSQTPQIYTFASTIMNVQIGPTTPGGLKYTTLAHLRITEVSPGPVDFGFDFRQTAGYVTDPPYAAPVLNEQHPHTYTNGNGQFIVAGFTSGTADSDSRDRSNTDDPRLAGINFNAHGNIGAAGSPFATFQVDLPHTGNWKIHLAIGDATNSQSQYVTISDASSALLNFVGVATNANFFMDATAAVYSAAAWPASETPVIVTVSPTAAVLIMQIGPTSPTGVNATTPAHLRITEIPAPTTPAATPTFTPDAGTYNIMQTITIACATAGSSIFYTVDGSTPTPSSQHYTGPISFAYALTLQAIATAPGFLTSAVKSAIYAFNFYTGLSLTATVTDSFAPDANPLNPALWTQWTDPSVTDGLKAVSGSAISRTASGFSFAGDDYTGASFPNNQFGEADCVVDLTQTTTQFNITIRDDGTGINTYVLGIFPNGDGMTSIYSIGTATAVFIDASNFIFPQGASFILAVVGTNLYALMNGVLCLGPFSDATYASGHVGIGVETASTNNDVKISSFRAGSAAVAAGGGGGARRFTSPLVNSSTEKGDS